MNSMLKKGLILGTIGFFIGGIVCLIIAGLTGDGSFSVNPALWSFSDWFYILIGCLHGTVCMASTVVYDVEEWSIARCTITHFVITFASFFAMAMIQGWMEPGDLFFWVWTLSWMAAWFMIWLILYFSYRRHIRKLNEELKELRSEDTVDTDNRE